MYRLMNSLKSHFDQVFDQIRQAEHSCHRQGQVKLLAVSKTKPAQMIRTAYDLGQRDFGENYLQEAMNKMLSLAELNDIQWHFIGPIQSNKTKDIASSFHWVHGVERLKIARRLNEQRPAHLPPVNICLQVNISQEDSKAGVHPENLPELVQSVSILPNLKLRGLMAIPTPESDPEKQRIPFRKLASLMADINANQSLDMDTLSMGMSGDLNAAITEGSTIVRIGTALFGARDYTTSSHA